MSSGLHRSHAATRPPRSAAGFTLLELLLAVAILSLVVAITIPSVSNDSSSIDGVASIIAADLEFAQMMTISSPGQPMVVSFDEQRNTYWLAFAADPATPIVHSASGQPYELTPGEGRAWAARGVTMRVADMNANRISFNAHGGLDNAMVAPKIELHPPRHSSASPVQISVAPITGRIMMEKIKKQ